MDEKFAKKVFGMAAEWEKAYREEAKVTRGRAIDWTCEHAGRERAREVAEALNDQIDFVKYLVAQMIPPGASSRNLERIRTFLSWQHLDESAFPGGAKPPFTVTFWGGDPLCARVHTGDLSLIDFEDSWAMLEFNRIYVRTTQWEKWTRDRVKALFTHIRQDMEDDGDDVELSLEFESDLGKPGTYDLPILCDVEEE